MSDFGGFAESVKMVGALTAIVVLLSFALSFKVSGAFQIVLKLISGLLSFPLFFCIFMLLGIYFESLPSMLFLLTVPMGIVYSMVIFCIKLKSPESNDNA